MHMYGEARVTPENLITNAVDWQNKPTITMEEARRRICVHCRAGIPVSGEWHRITLPAVGRAPAEEASVYCLATLLNQEVQS